MATAGYVTGLNGEQMTETNGTTQWAHTNVFANGSLVATYRDTNLYFSFEDWLGTKRAEGGVLSGGACLNTYYSLPFGNDLTTTGTCTDATEHHFTQKERDTESGNDYFEARYYTSTFGRFISPDWTAKEESGDPVPYAVLDDPQSLNLYAYVRNNPLTRVDADGHGELLDKFKAIFYAKVSAEAGTGVGVKLTKDVKVEAKATIGLEVKKTASGETTTAKAEAKADLKIGSTNAGGKASAEVQIEKDGKVNVGTPKLEVVPAGGAGSAEATPNEIELSGHSGVIGGAVGADLDKAKEFGAAVEGKVSSAIDGAVKKVLPNQN